MFNHVETRKWAHNAAALAALMLLLAPMSAKSQDPEQMEGNEYFASATLIDGHQDCQGPGRMAINTRAAMEDIEFVLTAAKTGENVIVRADSEVSPVSDICNKTVRRGTEHVYLEFPCRESPFETSFRRWVRKEKLSGQLTVDATLCASPTSLDLMAADWRLDITRGDDSMSIVGDLQHPQFIPEFQLSGGVSAHPNKQPLWDISRFDEGLSGKVGLACIPTGLTFRGDQQISVTTISKLQFIDRTSRVCESDDASCFGRVGIEDRDKSWRFGPMRNSMLYAGCSTDIVAEPGQ